MCKKALKYDDYDLLQIAGGFFILFSMSKITVSSEKRRELLACGGLLFMTLIWGFAFVVIKTSLDYVPPLYMLAARFTISAVVLAIPFIKRLLHVSKDTLIHGIWIGIALFLAELFQTYGCLYTTAGKNAFLTTIYVILTPLLTWVLCRKKPRPRVYIAAVMSLVGIGFISLTSISFTVQLGDYLTLVCGFFYALQIVLIGKYAGDEDPIVLCIIQLAVGAWLSWVLAPLVCGTIRPYMISKDIIYAMLYLGLLSTLVCFLLQNICQRYAPPAPAAILMSMESVFGALSSVIFLGEVMSPRMIVGCVLMFLAVIIVEIDVPVLSAFYPDVIIESAYDIDYEGLYADGIRGIIFDVDNTLVEHGAPADKRSKELLSRLSLMGFKVLFLSNNKEPRVKSFRDEGLPEGYYIYKAGKPKKAGYIKAMEVMETDLGSTVFIGDQLFTDVWGAKRSGLRNILTRPIHPKEEIQIVLKRKLERVVLDSYMRRKKESEVE